MDKSTTDDGQGQISLVRQSLDELAPPTEREHRTVTIARPAESTISAEPEDLFGSEKAIGQEPEFESLEAHYNAICI